MLTDKLNTAHVELSEAQKVSKARALIQSIRIDVIRINAEVQEIADSGVFDTIDAEIKDALIKAWDVVKDAETAFEDADVAELLDWRP